MDIFVILEEEAMETRKVQITGKSTYIISLPKTWVNKVKIKNGDSVFMIPRSDGTILVNPKLNMDEDPPKNTINLETQDINILFRKFIGAYLAGFDIIEINSMEKFSSSMRQEIRQIIHTVVGPEIIDETSNSVKIKDLLDSSDFSPAQGVKRMYIITRGMHRDAIIALQTQDKDLAEDVESRDDEVDKFCWMIAKQYNLVLNDMFFADKMQVSMREVLGYLLVARSIERIADHAKKLASNAKQIKVKIGFIPRITETSEIILKMFDDAINAFRRNKFEPANDVINRSKELNKTIMQLKQEIFSLDADAETIVSLAYIVDSLERTRAYILDIAEISINHQFAIMLSKKE